MFALFILLFPANAVAEEKDFLIGKEYYISSRIRGDKDNLPDFSTAIRNRIKAALNKSRILYQDYQELSDSMNLLLFDVFFKRVQSETQDIYNMYVLNCELQVFAPIKAAIAFQTSDYVISGKAMVWNSPDPGVYLIRRGDFEVTVMKALEKQIDIFIKEAMEVNSQQYSSPSVVKKSPPEAAKK